jgi:hypothetical protein
MTITVNFCDLLLYTPFIFSHPLFPPLILSLSLYPTCTKYTIWQVVELAKEIELAGASIINTGIGWHEARIPTIATAVPRGGYAWVTQKMKGKVVNQVMCFWFIGIGGWVDGVLGNL